MKKAIFLFFSTAMLLSCGTFSKKVEENYGCTKGDCFNGKGTYVLSNGDIYTGEFKDGKIKGSGTLKFTNGDIYTGNFQGAKVNGSGVLFYSNGDEYEGEFIENVPYGKGKYTYADGSIEKGYFANSLFIGQIKLPKEGDNQKISVSKVVDIKSSDFEVAITYTEGLKIGDKLFVEVNGTMCSMKVISHKNSVSICKMIGGTRFLVFQVSKDLPVYRIMNGIKRGGNTFLFPNGNKYIGEYKGNLMNGKGEFTWTNGFKYTGEFKNGMRNGKGTLKSSDNAIYGFVYTGEFKNGYFDGTGRFEMFGRYEISMVKKDAKDGYIYEGQWENGLKNGTGKKTTYEGDIYEGEFKNDLMNGKGTFIFSYGDKYTGEFKNDMMHGNGILYKPDGTVYQDGRWENDMFMGK